MKRVVIKTISMVLALVIVVFSAVSCDIGWGADNHIFPDGYTCGFGLQPGSPLEYWWVETYEECLDAIELLKSHGSTFSDDIVLAYDENLFDVKYCFVLIGDGRHGERIKYGDNPFDRWAYDIRIDTYAFFDDVTIDELVYSYTGRYETYRIGCSVAYKKAINNISKDKLEIGNWEKMSDGKVTDCCLYIRLDNEVLICIQTEFFVQTEEEITGKFKMTDECINYIINSAKIIELNSEE
ncbi:MAG: hypothetical protein IJX97_07220 [Clostridia bacterium]|nr:hypothetical protein [Clostridia bacterium]